ncbi:hypothetical protein LPU83_pLPU83b_0451 (plasmid) [Rhizobium favelukesii]|uniref:Transposase n=1 Tax=Rhizobium favelukesii TaxID=348824 RepID=W6S1Y4_9HYPH|nr:hypothetical protein LPU83_pLPU83b_0451 [Rhizobium favelukesii]
MTGGWLPGVHFSVDGTLIRAWAGHKRFKPKDGDDEGRSDFRGQSRSNHTHVPTSDSDARLYRKGSTASELRTGAFGFVLSTAAPVMSISKVSVARLPVRVLVSSSIWMKFTRSGIAVSPFACVVDGHDRGPAGPRPAPAPKPMR